MNLVGPFHYSLQQTLQVVVPHVSRANVDCQENLIELDEQDICSSTIKHVAEK